MRWPWLSDDADPLRPERNLTAQWRRLVESQPEGHPEVKPPTVRQVQPKVKPLRWRKRKA